jgi:hypothetical protein
MTGHHHTGKAHRPEGIDAALTALAAGNAGLWREVVE